MQIILVQQEVEQALRDYVASRLTLVEGTQFEIDLAATRGANGITATINLVSPGAAAAPAAKTAVASTSTATVRRSTPEAPTKAQETTAVVQTDPNQGQDPNTGNEGQEQGSTTTGGQQPDPADPNTAQATGDVNGDPVTGEGTDKPKSLFAGLTKPKNS